MTEEIDNNYRDEEELRKFKERKKKQDKLDKERENIIQPPLNTNIQNQQLQDKQYKFDVDIEETKNNQNNQSIYTPPKYSSYKKSHYDWLYKRFVQRASDDYQMQSGRNEVANVTEWGVDTGVVYGIESRKWEAEIKAKEIHEKTGKPYRMNVRALATKIHHQTEANAQTIKQEKYRAWQESQSQGGMVKIELEDLKRIKGQPLFAGENPQQKVRMSFKKYAELLDKLESKTRNHIYEKVESSTKRKYEKSQSSYIFPHLKQWRKEAQQLGRSQEYLNKIDRVIDYAGKNPDKFAQSDTTSLYNAMEQDRTEFKQLLERKEQHNKEQFYSLMAKRRR